MERHQRSRIPPFLIFESSSEVGFHVCNPLNSCECSYGSCFQHLPFNRPWPFNKISIPGNCTFTCSQKTSLHCQSHESSRSHCGAPKQIPWPLTLQAGPMLKIESSLCAARLTSTIHGHVLRDRDQRAHISLCVHFANTGTPPSFGSVIRVGPFQNVEISFVCRDRRR